MHKQSHQQKWFFPCEHIFLKLKEEGNLIYNINMYKQSHQQKWFFPCKHIFVKLKEEENLIYIKKFHACNNLNHNKMNFDFTYFLIAPMKMPKTSPNKANSMKLLYHQTAIIHCRRKKLLQTQRCVRTNWIIATIRSLSNNVYNFFLLLHQEPHYWTLLLSWGITEDRSRQKKCHFATIWYR